MLQRRCSLDADDDVALPAFGFVVTPLRLSPPRARGRQVRLGAARDWRARERKNRLQFKNMF